MWVALAALYLDTELTDKDFWRIAAVCEASGLAWNDIRQINYYEVAPALLANLQGVAGEWAGWDEEWLLARIRSHYPPKPSRLLGSEKLWRKQVDFYTKRQLTTIASYLT